MAKTRPWSVILSVAALLLLVAWGPAEAQLRAASAEVVRVTGRVEALRRGQTQWAAAAVGARLVDGDQIRAASGASADLSLPDGSTILVAENTRFAVTKLEYDARTRERNASFHLVAGKVRAQVSRAAVQLVRARESNFNISTPSGVAAVRGTIAVVLYNPATQQAIVISLPSPGEPPSAARVTWVNLATGETRTLQGNQLTTQIANNPPGTVVSTTTLSPTAQQQIQTAINTATAGSPTLTAVVVVIVSETQIQTVLTQAGIVTTTPTTTTTTTTDTTATSPTGTATENPQTEAPPAPPSCATPPC